MDHQIAIREKLAERYLLDELNETERETFEEHFFVCDQCAEDVRTAAGFVAGTRVVLAEDRVLTSTQPIDTPRRRLAWLWRPGPAYALAAAFGLLLVIQTATVNQGMRPEVLSSVELRPATRGAAPVVLLAGHQAVLLSVGVPAGSAYVCTVIGVNGEKAAEMQSRILQEPQLRLLLPSDDLRPGRYRLIVRDAHQSGENYWEEFQFEVQP